MATLALQQVQKAFDTVEVVHGVDPEFSGRSGCGKQIIEPLVPLRIDPAQLHLFTRDNARTRL